MCVRETERREGGREGGEREGGDRGCVNVSVFCVHTSDKQLGVAVLLFPQTAHMGQGLRRGLSWEDRTAMSRWQLVQPECMSLHPQQCLRQGLVVAATLCHLSLGSPAITRTMRGPRRMDLLHCQKKPSISLDHQILLHQLLQFPADYRVVKNQKKKKIA